MDAATGNNLVSDVILSIQVPRGSLFTDPGFGSRIKDVKKITAQSMNLIGDFVHEAIDWIVQAGRATSIDCTVTPASNVVGAVVITGQIVANDRNYPFSLFYQVA